MKKIIFFSLLLMLIISACADDSLNEPLATSESSSLVDDYIKGLTAYSVPESFREVKTTRKKTKVKKLKLTTEGTITLTPMGVDCENSMPLIFRTVNGEGNCTHLGLNTITLTYNTCGEVPISPPQGYQIAANGDSLYTMLFDADYDDNNVFFMDYIYTGGSGRFENLVDGYVRLYPTIWPIDMYTLGFTNYGSGWIMY